MKILEQACVKATKAITLICIFILLTAFFSCTKNEEPTPPDPVKNSSWYGRFHYSTGTLERVMCLYLKENDRFEWHDPSGVYTGSWKRADQKLTIIFDTNRHETTFDLNEKKLENQTNTNHNDWKILELSKIEKYPSKLSDSKWFDPYSWLITFTNDRLVFYYAGIPTVTGGSGDYKLNGPILTISNGNFDGKDSAGLFGVFRDEILMTANIMSGPGLGSVPTRISTSSSYIKQ